jgi:23S rRNA (guanine745-N1)-methyltransferase
VPALDDVLGLLRCPHCRGALARNAGTVRCKEGHSFDLARQGYLSLLAGGGTKHEGDSAEMVAARERFLAGGHFDPLAEEVVGTVAELAEEVIGTVAERAEEGAGRAEEGAGRAQEGPPCFVDLGAGSGWYLARALERLPAARGLALDLSKPALRRAARSHPRVAAVACDSWRPLPLRDGVAAAVLNVFAPRNGSEIARILRPGGAALVVTPAPEHLHELVAALGLLGVDERKEQRLAEQLAPGLEVVSRRELDWTLSLDRAEARDAAAMGPSAFHVPPAELDERIAALPERLEVTAAVALTLARSR